MTCSSTYIYSAGGVSVAHRRASKLMAGEGARALGPSGGSVPAWPTSNASRLHGSKADSTSPVSHTQHKMTVTETLKDAVGLGHGGPSTRMCQIHLYLSRRR